MPRASKREHIVTTALRRFAEDGFHGTGIDRIVEDAGVSKKTLYNHFRSKEELVLAVLAHYDSAFRNDFMRRVEAAAETPGERLLAIYDVAFDWFQEKRFFGCLFVNAVGEHSAPDTALRRICRGFKQQLRDYIARLAHEAGLESPGTVADELALLFEGAIATAHVSGSPEAARTARRVAEKVVESAR